MAVLKFSAIWLNDVAVPTDRLKLVKVRSWRKTPTKPGTFRRGAGGRVRLIRQAGDSVTWDLTFSSVTPEQKRWLADHRGRLLCFRDDRGGKMFGAYLSTPTDERVWSKDADSVSLSVTELTYSEAV